MSVASKDFYRTLTPFSRFAELTDRSHYQKVPDDWWVIITDVKGSTEALANNRYKDVNLLGASSIIAIMNTLKGEDVPFVFGGDGATLLVHESNIEKVKPALRGTQRLARDVLDFELRVGLVPMRVLSENGYEVAVAKFAISEKSSIATLTGGGLTYAEKLIKDPDNDQYRMVLTEDNDDDVASFEGLSCRWNPIKTKRGEIMSLLIIALHKESADEVYSRLIVKIESILNGVKSLPMMAPNVDGRPTFLPLWKEMKMLTMGQPFKVKVRRMISIVFELMVMQIFMRTGYHNDRFNAQTYIREMGENTDYQKFDDMIRMVRDCTFKQRDEILEILSQERERGEIAYGVHMSNEAMITCLVFQMDNHIHFVDGSNGGYALAAKQLKEQLKETALDRTDPYFLKQLK